MQKAETPLQGLDGRRSSDSSQAKMAHEISGSYQRRSDLASPTGHQSQREGCCLKLGVLLYI